MGKSITQIFIFLLTVSKIKTQDIECTSPAVCNQVTLSHTVQLKTQCVYLNIIFRNMTEEILPVGTFRLCKRALILDMSNNNIKSIKAGAFLGLASLRQLYLANNKIEKIEPGTFHTLTNLEVFVLTSNKLRSMPEYEFTSKSLKYFNINNNDINFIPESTLLTLRNMDLVDLSSNNLDLLNPFFLKNLQPGCTIILSNNQLNNISMEFVNVTKTNYNKFSTLEASSNIIKHLDQGTLGHFYKLNLQALDLSFNFISDIDLNTFENYVSLQRVLLSHNRIASIDTDVFKSLDNLTALDLSYNVLTNLVFQLKLPASITILNYSNNKIDYYTDYHWSMVMKRKNIYLDISNNSISYIDGNRFCKFMNRVNLAYNNWKCDVLYSIIRNLEMRGISVDSGRDYRTANIDGIPCEMGVSKLLDPGLESVREMLFKTEEVTTEVGNLRTTVSNDRMPSIGSSELNHGVRDGTKTKDKKQQQQKRNNGNSLNSRYFTFVIWICVIFIMG